MRRIPVCFALLFVICFRGTPGFSADEISVGSASAIRTIVGHNVAITTESIQPESFDNSFRFETDDEALRRIKRDPTLAKSASLSGRAGSRRTDLRLLTVLKNLEALEVVVEIEDDDLAHLTQFERLTVFYLESTRITDAGLKHLEGLKSLRFLGIRQAPITSGGLRHLSGLAELKHLDLALTDISDAGFRNLRGLSRLETIELAGTRITGGGFSHFEELRSLRKIGCRHTSVTDDGLRHLARVRTLERIDARHTNVTSSGAEELEKSLPAVVIRIH